MSEKLHHLYFYMITFNTSLPSEYEIMFNVSLYNDLCMGKVEVEKTRTIFFNCWEAEHIRLRIFQKDIRSQ